MREQSLEGARAIIASEVKRLQKEHAAAHSGHRSARQAFLKGEIDWLGQLAESTQLLQQYLREANARPKPGHRNSTHRE